MLNRAIRGDFLLTRIPMPNNQRENKESSTLLGDIYNPVELLFTYPFMQLSIQPIHTDTDQQLQQASLR